MVYNKLEDAIKNVLKGCNYGNNTIIVRTTNLGEVIIEDYDDSATIEENDRLKEENEEYSYKVEELESEIDSLNEKIEKLEENE